MPSSEPACSHLAVAKPSNLPDRRGFIEVQKTNGRIRKDKKRWTNTDQLVCIYDSRPQVQVLSPSLSDCCAIYCSSRKQIKIESSRPSAGKGDSRSCVTSLPLGHLYLLCVFGVLSGLPIPSTNGLNLSHFTTPSPLFSLTTML